MEDIHKYGVPEQKKFPMPDADHVRSAIRFFNYVEPKYEKQLAKAILARMEEYGLNFDDFTVGEENRFSKYVPKDELKHHGILGQKWGIRRYQNPDGTLTEAGKERYFRTGVTKSGDRFIVKEMEPGKIAKFLQNHSARIKREAEKSINADIYDKENKIIGNLQLYNEGNNSLNGSWLCIKESERGKGYATAVLKDVIDFAKENGYKQMTLEVPGYSPDARHIYEKLGFQVVKELSNPDEDIVWGGLTAMVLKFDELEHHGILGQKWGVRRYQNQDGSLTVAGKEIIADMAKKTINSLGVITMDEYDEMILSHHGILGQKWGVRRYQNEDGTLTDAGRRRIHAQKARTMSSLERKSKWQKRLADYDKEEIKDIKTNGAKSERIKQRWQLMTDEEKTAMAGRGGYDPNSPEVLMDILLGLGATKNGYAMNQLIKEELKDLKDSHAAHIRNAKEYTKRYEDLSVKDVEQMAVELGYKEAKKQIRRS